MAIARLFDGLVPADILQSAAKSVKKGLFNFEDIPTELMKPELVGGREGLISLESSLSTEAAEKLRDNLVLANKMFKRGQPNEDILARTGFWFDENGNVKYEIDDSAAQLNVPFEDLKPGMQLLAGQLLQHDKFYQYYPDLAYTPINFYRGKETEVGGFNLSTGEIDLNLNSAAMVDRNPTVATADLLHEVQHGIQKFEKFSQGGSKQQFLKDIAQPTAKEEEEAFRKYLSLAGEAEARNVWFRYAEPKIHKEAILSNIPSVNKVKGKNFLQTFTKDPFSEKYGITPAQLTDNKGNPIDIRNEISTEDLMYRDPLERTI